jgi:DNA replication initiation complex subunit (GINS family)
VKSEIVAKAKEEERQKREAVVNTDAPLKAVVIADTSPPATLKKVVQSPEAKSAKNEESPKPIVV